MVGNFTLGKLISSIYDFRAIKFHDRNLIKALIKILWFSYVQSGATIVPTSVTQMTGLMLFYPTKVITDETRLVQCWKLEVGCTEVCNSHHSQSYHFKYQSKFMPLHSQYLMTETVHSFPGCA